MKTKRFTNKRTATKFAVDRLLDGATVQVSMSGLLLLDGRDARGGYVVHYKDSCRKKDDW